MKSLFGAGKRTVKTMAAQAPQVLSVSPRNAHSATVIFMHVFLSNFILIGLETERDVRVLAIRVMGGYP